MLESVDRVEVHAQFARMSRPTSTSLHLLGRRVLDLLDDEGIIDVCTFKLLERLDNGTIVVCDSSDSHTIVEYKV
jgi:hypothetical protein